MAAYRGIPLTVLLRVPYKIPLRVLFRVPILLVHIFLAASLDSWHWPLAQDRENQNIVSPFLLSVESVGSRARPRRKELKTEHVLGGFACKRCSVHVHEEIARCNTVRSFASLRQFMPIAGTHGVRKPSEGGIQIGKSNIGAVRIGMGLWGIFCCSSEKEPPKEYWEAYLSPEYGMQYQKQLPGDPRTLRPWPLSMTFAACAGAWRRWAE